MYKYPRKSWYKSRKSNGKCECCGKELPDNQLFSYVDESNAAITRNSKYYCWKCYNEKYPNDKIGLNTILQINGYKTFIDQDSYELWVRRDNETEWKKYKLPINSEDIIKELVTNIERE